MFLQWLNSVFEKPARYVAQAIALVCFTLYISFWRCLLFFDRNSFRHLVTLVTPRILYRAQYHRHHYTLLALNSLEHCICTISITMIANIRPSTSEVQATTMFFKWEIRLLKSVDVHIFWEKIKRLYFWKVWVQMSLVVVYALVTNLVTVDHIMRLRYMYSMYTYMYKSSSVSYINKGHVLTLVCRIG